MPRLVTKFKYLKYLKPNRKVSAGGYAKYIATRDGVDKIDDTQKFAPATTKQKNLIEKIIKDFPDCKEMFEYADYLEKLNMGTASDFISRAIEDNAYEMVGILENDSVMTKKLQRFGYVDVRINKESIIGSDMTNFEAHEFHRSKLTEHLDDQTVYSVEKDRGNGNINKWSCGYTYKNFLGGYAHIHFYNNLEIPRNFLYTCEKRKK